MVGMGQRSQSAHRMKVLHAAVFMAMFEQPTKS